MRITVALILNLVANGMSKDEITKAYPYLEAEDIDQALQYAAWLAEDSVHELALAADYTAVEMRTGVFLLHKTPVLIQSRV